jgi:DNA-binding NarL/FixJ family response regulator
MDIRMPVLDGIAATAQIVQEDLPTGCSCSRRTTSTTSSTALQQGAAGFLLTSTPVDRFSQGIEVVVAGEALLFPSLT